MRGVPADKSAAMMAPKQKVEKPMRIMGRLFGYILRRYKLHCLGVLLFIFGSTAATVVGNLFMKTLIDDYIVPYIGEGGASDFGPLLAALLKMGCVFLFGVLCTLLYNRIMVYVSQGTMRAIRDDLFRHMERLPIRYFDTHAHGDIMSIYTNDIDTLRQMISQSMPQLVSSAVTIVSVFCSMLALSLPLTGLTLVMVCLMLFTTKKLTSRSGAYFVAQQRNLGTVNGYIEEMMEGQKVVKVFCHYPHARHGQHRQPQLCAHGHPRLAAGALRHGRLYAGRAGILSAVQQKLQPAHLTGISAVQLHHHGAGRRGARIQPDG